MLIMQSSVGLVLVRDTWKEDRGELAGFSVSGSGGLSSSVVECEVHGPNLLLPSSTSLVVTDVDLEKFRLNNFPTEMFFTSVIVGADT